MTFICPSTDRTRHLTFEERERLAYFSGNTALAELMQEAAEAQQARDAAWEENSELSAKVEQLEWELAEEVDL